MYIISIVHAMFDISSFYALQDASVKYVANRIGKQHHILCNKYHCTLDSIKWNMKFYENDFKGFSITLRIKIDVPPKYACS